MSYTAYVTTLKNVRPHPNADRLQLGDCFGNTVCVSLEYAEGQVGVYFPTDGQLSVEFAEKNNLVRRKDEDGNNIGGYMDPNKRNVTAIKLRGEKSDGLFLPLSCLAYAGDVSKLNVGDTIDVFNGHEICKKYIPNVQNKTGSLSPGNHTRKKKVPIAPLFVEHADTEQLAYNMGAFKPGDDVEITLKMHGCFISGTKVRTPDGLKEIQKLKAGDKVLALNHNTGKIEATKILNIFHNEPSSKWRKVKISREGLRGDKRGYITCTPNHPFWSQELNCYIEAKDLKVGQTIHSLFESYVLTKMQKEILIGSYLGDGCLLTNNNRVAWIEAGSKEEHQEYQEWLSKITQGFYNIKNGKYTSGYGTTMIRGTTPHCADLYNYFNDIVYFDNKRKDKLKEELVNRFTILSAAILYMDDGSLTHSEKQQDRALIAICDYSENDANIILKCFNKLNLYPVYYKDSNGYNRLRFNFEEAKKFFELIAEYIPPVMQYKLPKKYRERYKELIDPEKHYKGYVLSPQTVLENEEISELHKEYDLETELHNYIVGLNIVHNTSQRTGYLPIFQKYKRSLWDKITHKTGTPIYDWGYVTGTRRTVLEGTDGGFYGSNEFREQHAKQFEGKLWKNEEVFYEVVGYTTTGQTIMGQCSNKKLNDKAFVKQYGDITTFAYGCEPCHSDMYVYRMTMTNEDGQIVEYTPEFMRYRCEQMGVKCVPVLWRGRIPENPEDVDGDVSAGEWIKAIAEQYYDGPDPIGKTHVREGVVCRIVNRPKFAAYKHKSFAFKCLEGLVKATAEAPDMEEADGMEENE
jgi:RNA ligase (TIGR02306 family)